MDFSNFFNEVKSGLSQVVSKAKSLREKTGSLLWGEDEEYNTLATKYEPVLKSKAEAAKNSGNTNAFLDTLMNPQKALKEDVTYLQDPEFRKFIELQQAKVNGRLFDIGGVSSGITRKLVGKFGKEVAEIVSSKIPDDIFTRLKGLKVSDEVARPLSQRLATIEDGNVVHQIIRGAQAVSDVETSVGARLLPEQRSEISEAVNKVVKNTTDSSTENMALKKLKEDFQKKFEKTAEDIEKSSGKLQEKISSSEVKSLIKTGFEEKRDEVIKQMDELNTTETFQKFGKNEVAAYGKFNDVLDALKKSPTDKSNVTRAEAMIKKINDIKESSRSELSKLFTAAQTGHFDEFEKIVKQGVGRESKRLAQDPEALKRFFMQSKGAENLAGVGAGIEVDENGNIRIDPLKAAAGVAGLSVAKKLKPSLVRRVKKAEAGQAKKLASKVKKSQIIKPKDKVTITAQTALKVKLKAEAKGAKTGKSLGKKIGSFLSRQAEKIRIRNIHNKYTNKQETLQNFRKAVRQYAQDLPLNIRRKILSQVKFSEIKSGKQLSEILSSIDRGHVAVRNENLRREVLRDVANLRRMARERGLAPEVNSRIAKLGIRSESMLKSSSSEMLEKIKSLVKESLDRTPTKANETVFTGENLPGTSKTKFKSAKEKMARGIESGLGVISTNIRKYGGDALFYAVRKRRFELNLLSKRYADKVAGFETGITKMGKKWFGGKKDYEEMTYSLFNGNFDRAKEIAKKYGFEKDFDSMQEVLADILKRANEAELKVGETKNYFPRIVADYDGLFKAYNAKFGKEGRSYFQKILDDAERKNFNRPLTEDERADILTKALRGYGDGKINAGSANKARKFRELPLEFIKFYHTPENSLTMYIQKMNDRITLKKMFGLEGAEQDSIGALVEKMDITPDNMFRLKEALGGILSPKTGENIALNMIRKSATLTLLSHISSTLFQIADIGLNAYKHGIGRAVASLIRKKPIKRDELFTDITYEFADSGLIRKSLKAVGFDRLDRLNVESFMGNAFRQASRWAKSTGKKRLALEKEARGMFRGNEEQVQKFLDDLKGGKVTDDTRFYIFNKVLDVSPRALEEMPEAYVKYPNARIFYSMKSYAIKVLDVYRNDVAKKWKDSPATATKNFIWLTSTLAMAGATGSQIRDWYNGKETKFSDNVMNSLLNLMLLSSYDVGQIGTDGIGKAILSKGLPATRLFDDIGRDLINAGDGKGVDSVRNIPVVGNEIYNRIGKGRDKIEKKNEAQKADPKNFTGTLTTDQKIALAEMKVNSPAKYRKVVREIKWEQLGIEDKERSFYSMGVEDGERPEAIAKYLKKHDDWKLRYARMKKAGIITEDVEKQLKYLMQ